MNCPGDEMSGRHNDPATAGVMTGVDRFANCVRRIRLVIGHGAEPGNVEIACRKLRRFDTRENRGRRAPVDNLCLRSLSALRRYAAVHRRDEHAKQQRQSNKAMNQTDHLLSLPALHKKSVSEQGRYRTGSDSDRMQPLNFIKSIRTLTLASPRYRSGFCNGS